jgi:short-subunit dehydrogenase
VLLTGASGAIGSELARTLAERGARLALSGRREAPLDGLAHELVHAGHPPPAVLVADLARRGEAATLADRAVEALGDIDILINNAGASLQGLGWLVGDRDEAREVFETNYWGPLALTAALAPRMVARRNGTIINVGSMARVSPFPHLGHYAASRAAVATATAVLEMELRPRGVRVIEVALGPVDTPASRENRILRGADRWLDGRPGLGSPKPAAAAIAAAAESDRHGVVFYPRALRWAYLFPGLGRHYSRRTAKRADVDDDAVRVGGSSGAPELRVLRQERSGTGGAAAE